MDSNTLKQLIEGVKACFGPLRQYLVAAHLPLFAFEGTAEDNLRLKRPLPRAVREACIIAVAVAKEQPAGLN